MARLKGKIKVNSSGPTLHTFKTWLSFFCSSTVAFLLIVVTLISYRLFITAKIAQIKFHRFLIFSFLKNWGMFDDLELNFVTGSLEIIPSNLCLKTSLVPLQFWPALLHLVLLGGWQQKFWKKKNRVNNPLRKQTIIFQIDCLKIFSATKKVIPWPVTEHQLLVWKGAVKKHNLSLITTWGKQTIAFQIDCLKMFSAQRKLYWTIWTSITRLKRCSKDAQFVSDNNLRKANYHFSNWLSENV